MRWLAVSLMVAGCATLGQALRFQEPDIKLQEIRVTGLGLTGGSLDLALDVFNPNDYRLRTTRLELGIDLEDVHFGDALLETPLELPSQQHSPVTVPVQFEWAGVGAGARALLSRQAVRFGLTGVATLSTPVGDRRVQVHGSGEVPLKALLR
ncbi:MAG TPA: LEA type 2 family protein [Gemmatimonadales bacterium]